MNGYGKPGHTREEFEREMNAELGAIPTLDREWQEDGAMTLTLDGSTWPVEIPADVSRETPKEPKETDMSDTTTVAIPPDVKDNSETVTDYAFRRDRAMSNYPYHTLDTRDREISRVAVFPQMGLAHYRWHDISPDGQRCRFDMITESGGTVVNLFHTEYFTRVGCRACEVYVAQSYATYYVSDGGSEGFPLCDEHVHTLRKYAPHSKIALSERLRVGQH